ncbi:MAG: hypothetical protein V2A34_06895 [Lentisphaerota bacterium]
MNRFLAVLMLAGWGVGADCSAGLLTDESFESPDTNEWTGSSWTGTGCSRDKWAAHFGKWGVAVPTWGGDPTATNEARLTQFVSSDITLGQTYTLSAWIRKQAAVRDHSIQLQIRWWDETWSSLKTETETVSVPGDDLWHQIFITRTADVPAVVHASAAISIQWLLTNQVGPSAIMVDDAELVTGSYTGTAFANGSFTQRNTESDGFAGSQWNRTAAQPASSVPHAGFAAWANRTGSDCGVAIQGNEQDEGGVVLSQNFYPGAGACTFAVWMNRQANFGLTNAEIRIGWYDATFTNKVQADSVRTLQVSSVDGWHEYWVTGRCDNASLREVRVSIVGKWQPFMGQANSLCLDDARVTAGTYTPAYALAFTNGSFENPSDTKDWDNTGWTCSGSAQRTNWAARTGTRGLVVESWGANQTAVFQDIETVEGAYTFSAWTQIGTNSDPQSLRLLLEWGGPDGGVIQTDSMDLNPVPKDNNWYRGFITGTCTNPSVRFVRPIIYALYGSEKVTNAGANTIHFDDAEFAAGSLVVPSAFTDGSFEAPSSTNLWSGSGWTASGNVGRENWAGRTNIWGGVVQAWVAGGAGTVYQDVLATGGTNTLSMWVLKQPGARATNMQLSLEWYNSSQWAPLHSQSSALNDSDVPADGRWHHVWVTGSYDANDALFLRAKLSCQFAAGEATENAIMFDEAELVGGTHVMPELSPVLRDGGFETPHTNWAEVGWSRIAPVYLQDWAAREGVMGVALPTWEGTNRGALYQDVSVTPGTQTFSMWIRPQVMSYLTNATLSLEWYNAEQFAPIQVDTRNVSAVPADGHWHQIQVTGNCTSGSVAFVRPVFMGQYLKGGSGENAIMLDQAELYSGPFAGIQAFTNGSFASDLRRWTVSPGFNQITVHTDWGGHSGSHLLAVEGWWGDRSSYTSSVAQTLVGLPAGTYRFGAWFKRDIDFSIQSARLRIKGYNAAHTLLFNAVTNLIIVPNGQWAEFGLSVDCTAEGLSEVVPSFDLEWTKVNGGLQLDDFTFELTSSDPDSDHDGIEDDWEMKYFGSLTGTGVSSNFDGDAYTDAEEYAADCDPKNAQSFLDVKVPGGNSGKMHVLIGLSTTNSRVYQVFWSSNLLDSSWGLYGASTTGRHDGAALDVTITNTTPDGYYRVQVSVP